MTDLEMTRLCAEAMGIWHCSDTDTDFVGQPPLATVNTYNPLHDDAQAMALDTYLMKCWVSLYMVPNYAAFFRLNFVAEVHRVLGDMTDPSIRRRARVECVAKMQESKQ